MAAPNPAPRHQGRVLVDRYEVDERLLELHLTRPFVEKCAFQGDIERRSAPVFGFPGHPEYNAGSRIRSALCEFGGETDGGWHADAHHGIPVAFNHNETIAIHPTGGSDGTGQVEGLPHNQSIKGPWSRKASEESAQGSLDIDDPDNVAVDFWWFFTRRDLNGLWAELYAPVIEEGGYASGWTERILIGNLGDDLDPMRSALPVANPTPDIPIIRRSA